MKLARKIAAVVLLGVTIVVLVLTALIFEFTKNTVEKSIGEQQLSLTIQTMAVIDRFLYERYLDIQTIGGSATLREYITTSIPNRKESLVQFNTYQQTTGPWDILSVVDKSGTIKLSTLQSEHEKPLRRHRDSFIAFENALKGSVYFSDMVISSRTGKPAVIFAVPMFDENDPGKPVIGAIIGHISWQSIQEILDEVHAHAVLLNSQGVVIAHNTEYSNIDFFLKDYSDSPAVIQLKEEEKGTVIAKKGSAFLEEDTLASLAFGQGYLSYTGSNWSLILEVPTRIAFSPAFQAATKTSLSTLPIFVIWLAVILFVFNHIVNKPVSKLTHVAKEIASGNFSARAESLSEDEFGVLAEAFNSMTNRLQKAYKEVEVKAEALTSKVEDLEKAKKATVNLLEDLNHEKAKDEAILASIGEGLVVVDKDLKTILINRAAEVATGWRTSEVLGKIWGEIVEVATEDGKKVPPDETPLSLAIRGDNLASKPTIYLYTRKDKTTFPVAVTVSPFRVGKELIGAVLIFRDITHERDIDKAKTEFVSLASHQLRTPLSTINWYAEMLLAGDAGKVNDEQKKYLEEIYTGNQRMVELVNALLNTSRLELGTFVVEPEPTDIVLLAKSVSDEQKSQIAARKLKFVPSFAKDIPIIQADQKLLRMVFQNLLSNAIKYTPEGGKIEFSLSWDNKKNILIKFSDTGYGIPKVQQDKMFTKLFRADNVKEKDTEGTGLGLYIVKAIIDHSGGKIWFESEENKGTTFYITLPLDGMKKKESDKALS